MSWARMFSRIVVCMLFTSVSSCDCERCQEPDCAKCPPCYCHKCEEVTCDQAPCKCEVWGKVEIFETDSVVQPAPDTKPEEVKPLKITLIIDQSVLTGIVQVGAMVTGGKSERGVEFYVDTVKIDQDLIPPYSTSLNTAEFPDGDHYLTAFTSDLSGQQASMSLPVTFDNTPPQILTTLPTANAMLFFEDGPMHMEMTVDDPMTIKNAKFRANGMLVAEFMHPPFSANVEYGPLFIELNSLPKNIFLQYQVTDYLGQTAEKSFNVTVHKRHDWTFSTLGEIWAGATALNNGNVLFGNLNDTVFCLSSSGELVWSYSLPGGDGDVMGTPAYDPASGRIFVPTIGGVIHALSESGGQIWVKDIGSPVAGDLVFKNGTVYASGYSGTVWALNPNSGSEKWVGKLNANIMGGLCVGNDGKVYVGAKDKLFYAIENGSVIWTMPTGGEIWGTATIGPDQTIYIGSNDGYLYAVEMNGQKKWLKELEPQIWTRPLYGSDGFLYVTTTGGYIFKVNAMNGTIEWSTKVGAMTKSWPVQGLDGQVLVGTNAGKVVAVEPEKGTQIWSYQVGNTIHATLLVNAGRVYFGSTDRNFYSLWLSPP